MIDRTDSSDGRINGSPFNADHVVDVRRGPVSDSGRITIRGNQKKKRRPIPAGFGNVPTPITMDPALTLCRIVLESSSDTSMRNSGRRLRNSLIAWGRMYAATISPAPIESV